MFEAIFSTFRKGGWGMWPILAMSIFMVSIVVERVWFIYIRSNINAEIFTRQILGMIAKRDLEHAINTCNSYDAPLSRIVAYGLRFAEQGGGAMQRATDEISLQELPRLEKRTPYLGMVANVSVLMGLLGTITGLILCFGSLSGTAAEKTAKLSQGIAEAMNCTAFGLIVAIPALLAFSILNGKVQKLMGDVDFSVVRIINAVREAYGR
jgi:biopolymer transport protein ExbB/TolQ